MNKEEIAKAHRHKLMNLLYDLKQGELCTPECYGCCGDNERSFAYCPDAIKNFEKRLAELGYRQIADNEVVVEKYEYEELKSIAKAYDDLPYIEPGWGM
jgi:hypothetical protein